MSLLLLYVQLFLFWFIQRDDSNSLSALEIHLSSQKCLDHSRPARVGRGGVGASGRGRTRGALWALEALDARRQGSAAACRRTAHCCAALALVTLVTQSPACTDTDRHRSRHGHESRHTPLKLDLGFQNHAVLVSFVRVRFVALI